MNDIGQFLDQHRSELIAVLAGVLGALALLVLINVLPHNLFRVSFIIAWMCVV